jgi:DNA-binding IclR family transcriptional regulator
MRKQVSINESTANTLGSVGTLGRGLDVLELIGASGPGLTQKQISDALHLPMPTVHRLTALLTERGWLDRDPGTRRLRLGLEVARLIPALLTGTRLADLARPHLLRLATEMRETVNFAVLQGGEVVYLLSESGDRLLAPQVVVGMRLPAHCTALGKCLLAQLPPDIAYSALGREPYGRRTKDTITSWRKLNIELGAIRISGVAVSDEEYEEGLVSIAAPVDWTEGPGTAAINVSLPAGRATPRFREQLRRGLVNTAAAVSREMPGRPA